MDKSGVVVVGITQSSPFLPPVASLCSLALWRLVRPTFEPVTTSNIRPRSDIPWAHRLTFLGFINSNLLESLFFVPVLRYRKISRCSDFLNLLFWFSYAVTNEDLLAARQFHLIPITVGLQNYKSLHKVIFTIFPYILFGKSLCLQPADWQKQFLPSWVRHSTQRTIIQYQKIIKSDEQVNF